jgi:hypothetical protein
MEPVSPRRILSATASNRIGTAARAGEEEVEASIRTRYEPATHPPKRQGLANALEPQITKRHTPPTALLTGSRGTRDPAAEAASLSAATAWPLVKRANEIEEPGDQQDGVKSSDEELR